MTDQTAAVFTDSHRQTALDVARDSILARLTGHAVTLPDIADFPAASGVFVTIKVQGQLRGCLGTLDCGRALLVEIGRCAADAATVDRRFAPIGFEELPALSIEISVLGPLEQIDPSRANAIEIGVHGLVIEQGSHRGLLLPQVASERRWTVEHFLRQTCVKAYLPPDAWERGATVYRFDAEIFGSEAPGI
jgi:AmmeMemoRadiSam system protein A